MTDPNRARWEREAEEYADSYLGHLSPREMTVARSSYLAACEKYAPRWVDHRGAEMEELRRIGWRVAQAKATGVGNPPVRWLDLMTPPAPPPPGGEE